MTGVMRNSVLFAGMLGLLVIVGFMQSWSVAFAILNLCLISSVMALGVNIQWGYAGLFNAGIMGFAALGGVAAVLVSVAPVGDAWAAGGTGVLITLLIMVITISASVLTYRHLYSGRGRSGFGLFLIILIVVFGYFLARLFYDPAVAAIEAVEPAKTGFLGGLGLPILFSWIVGGALAAGVAWVVGKIALGLRSDYLAIATLGISEIIIAILRNEDWLTRGVKNVNGLPRPVAFEVDIQQSPYYQELAANLGMSVIEFSSLYVKLSYAGLFLIVLLIVLYLSETALRSPWGRMMRAIRDNETAANAMGKNVTGRRLQAFVLGSAVVGLAGAMLTTLDGQFTPSSYQPLRFTFLIWIMVIVGGSGNNFGAILGGFIVWFAWVQAEPLGLWLIETITAGLDDQSDLKQHLLQNAQQMRLVTMGLILLLVLRFSPQGLIPERNR
ncbi:MAG: branched-chain amino acid ABC transporter permease [Pseudomonadota bacterium]